MSDQPEHPDAFQASDPTAILLDGARAGSERAVALLLERYRERLRRWAAGRLPEHARDTDDTEDLVQDVLVSSLRHLEDFQERKEGAFHSYLRTAILNRIRNRVRHAQVRERAEDQIAERQPRPRSPLEELLGADALERYERALESLREQDRELVVARMEFDCTYEELAEMTGRPSANATRMALQRALVRLARAMGEIDDGRTQAL